ncbi:GDSL esterase/lipase [Platanthera zijinensis]|uniref:GDSL esterase/lipase n=1 Tax=Platanthera zijinensis TaxID=2320716 RepID=A0AAP0BTG3_9ASPA
MPRKKPLSNSTRPPLLLLLPLFLLACAAAKSQATAGDRKSPISAIFAFGDSTVDTGNNNYIATALKSNFPPYGRDFLTHMPTGRFTNGKLIPDFVASYLGIKEELPPYLDWSLGEEELLSGVSFGSAGSGLDPLTASLSAVISVLDQVDYFRNYINRIDQMVGVKRRRDLIKTAVFVLSSGTNDFIAYSTVPLRGEVFSVEGYQGFLLTKVKEFIQVLSDLGANRIVVSGLPPMGCLPIVITLKASDGIHDRGCINSLNSIALDYNTKLRATLREYSSSSSSSEAQMFYVDPFKPLLDIITSPASYVRNDRLVHGLVQSPVGLPWVQSSLNYAVWMVDRQIDPWRELDASSAVRHLRGMDQDTWLSCLSPLGLVVLSARIMQNVYSFRPGFNKSSEGCCGTGLVEAAVLCNLKSLVCTDASKYVFWDSMHPTEKAYFITFNSFRPVIEQVLKSY